MRRSCKALVGAVISIFFLSMGVTAAPAHTGPPGPGAVPSRCTRGDASYTCTVGPFDLDAGEREEIMTMVAAPSEAGYITAARATLVDGDGEEIALHMVHLHHAVWLNPMRRDLTCDSFDGGVPNFDRFFATGKERTPLVLPDGYGYHWSNRASQRYTQSSPFWGLVAHLDGMHGHSSVYIELKLEFVAEADADGITDVRPVWLDVRNCQSDPVFDVEQGSGRNGVYKERWSYEMPVAGRFVALAGHLHDGGLRLGLANATTGRPIFTSIASYGLAEEPWFLTRMSSWSSPDGIAVAGGDVVRLTAAYDSTRSWDDVMGIMVGFLVPD